MYFSSSDAWLEISKDLVFLVQGHFGDKTSAQLLENFDHYKLVDVSNYLSNILQQSTYLRMDCTLKWQILCLRCHNSETRDTYLFTDYLNRCCIQHCNKLYNSCELVNVSVFFVTFCP